MPLPPDLVGSLAALTLQQRCANSDEVTAHNLAKRDDGYFRSTQGRGRQDRLQGGHTRKRPWLVTATGSVMRTAAVNAWFHNASLCAAAACKGAAPTSGARAAPRKTKGFAGAQWRSRSLIERRTQEGNGRTKERGTERATRAACSSESSWLASCDARRRSRLHAATRTRVHKIYIQKHKLLRSAKRNTPDRTSAALNCAGGVRASAGKRRRKAVQSLCFTRCQCPPAEGRDLLASSTAASSSCTARW